VGSGRKRGGLENEREGGALDVDFLHLKEKRRGGERGKAKGGSCVAKNEREMTKAEKDGWKTTGRGKRGERDFA